MYRDEILQAVQNETENEKEKIGEYEKSELRKSVIYAVLEE